jgi:hypothetical protein
MNIRTLMTTSLVTLLLVSGAQAKEGDNYLKIRTAEQAQVTTPAKAMTTTTAASDNTGNLWVHRDSDRT